MIGKNAATGKIIDDFFDDKIVFRSSPLKSSPEITMQTINKSVWYAYLLQYYIFSFATHINTSQYSIPHM